MAHETNAAKSAKYRPVHEAIAAKAAQTEASEKSVEIHVEFERAQKERGKR